MTESLGSKMATRRAEFAAFRRVFPKVLRGRPGTPWSPSQVLALNASKAPTDIALKYLDRQVSWREIDEAANRVAHTFQKLGIGAGDTVAILMDNRPEFLFAVMGLNRIRAVAALINTNIAGKALAHALRIADTRKLVVGAEHAEKIPAVLPELEDLSDDDVFVQTEGQAGAEGADGFASFDALVAGGDTSAPEITPAPNGTDCMCYIYTSGTTGLPKAAIISNKRFLGSTAFMGLGMYGLKRGDVAYVPLPLYHSVGFLGGWGGALTAGSTLAFRARFSASEFWSDVCRFDATLFVYIGELCRYLLNQPESPDEKRHNLRMAAGNGLRPDIWERFQSRFNIPTIREYYGATESPTGVVNFTGRPGMVGRMLFGLAVARCDQETGELRRDANGRCTKVDVGETGLLLMKIAAGLYEGYVDKEATKKKIVKGAFAEGEVHFNTGDLVMLHEDGWLSFADRVGDTYRWKGENVSTNEVAEILNGAQGVLETNVYGVEVPGAEGRAGMASIHIDDTFAIESFAEYVTAELAPYQRPYFVRLQKEMQVTVTLKHQKVDYRRDGYDPARVSDPLYLLEGKNYVPLDARAFADIQSGSRTIR